MAKATHAINVKTGAIYIATEAVLSAPNMAPCDKDGQITAGATANPEAAAPEFPAEETASPVAAPEAPAPEPEPEPEEPDGPLSLDEYQVILEAMELDELKAKATELEVEFAGNIGKAKLCGRILEQIAENLKAAEDGAE